jgi:hypothetical protein
MSEIVEKDETKPTTIDVNVALVISERDHYKKLAEEKELLVADLTKRLKQATDLIEEDSKAALITEVAPMWKGPRDALGAKTVEELQHIKYVQSFTQIPAFRSGTPIVPIDKSPEAKLASAFDDYAKKTWRKS